MPADRIDLWECSANPIGPYADAVLRFYGHTPPPDPPKPTRSEGDRRCARCRRLTPCVVWTSHTGVECVTCDRCGHQWLT